MIASDRYTLESAFTLLLMLVVAEINSEGDREWGMALVPTLGLDDPPVENDAYLVLDLGKIVGRAFSRVHGEDQERSTVDVTEPETA